MWAGRLLTTAAELMAMLDLSKPSAWAVLLGPVFFLLICRYVFRDRFAGISVHGDVDVRGQAQISDESIESHLRGVEGAKVDHLGAGWWRVTCPGTDWSWLFVLVWLLGRFAIVLAVFYRPKRVLNVVLTPATDEVPLSLRVSGEATRRVWGQIQSALDAAHGSMELQFPTESP